MPRTTGVSMSPQPSMSPVSPVRTDKARLLLLLHRLMGSLASNTAASQQTQQLSHGEVLKSSFLVIGKRCVDDPAIPRDVLTLRACL